MAEYVWQHDLAGERDRLRLMSDMLDPSSRFHLLRTGVTAGWRCLEIGAGNGSLSQWLAQRVGPAGHVIASDIRISHRIDYYVGRKIPPWVQEDGLVDVTSEGHAILYNGGSTFAQWWDFGIREVADKLQSEGGVSQATLDEFLALCRDPAYWTTTIAFTATTARSPA
jgi:ubiquinone/menaquinone biosynthesis C-methylase UbiE